MYSNMIRAFAVNARIKGMEVCNQERLSNGASIAYTCNQFFEAEEELVGLAESEESQVMTDLLLAEISDEEAV